MTLQQFDDIEADYDILQSKKDTESGSSLTALGSLADCMDDND